MADVDINGFDIVFTSEDAQNAKAIDKAIENIATNIKEASSGMKGFRDSLQSLTNINPDELKKKVNDIKTALSNIEETKPSGMFDTAQKEADKFLDKLVTIANKLSNMPSAKIGFATGDTEVVESKAQHAKTTVRTTDSATTSAQVDVSLKFNEQTLQAELRALVDKLSALFKDIPVSLKKELDLTYFEGKARELKEMFSGITVPTPKAKGVQTTEGVAPTPKPNTEGSQLSADTTRVLEMAFERMDTIVNEIVKKIQNIGSAENTVFTDLCTDIQAVTVALQGLTDKFANFKLPNALSADKNGTDGSILDLSQTNKDLAEATARLDALQNKLAQMQGQGGGTQGFWSTIKNAILDDYTTEEVAEQIEAQKRLIAILEERKEKLEKIINTQGKQKQQAEETATTEQQVANQISQATEQQVVATERNIAGLRAEIKERREALREGEGITLEDGKQQSAVDALARSKAELKAQETSLTEQLKKQYDELLKLDKIYDKLAARENLNMLTDGKSGDLTTSEIELQERINKEIGKRKELIDANIALSTEEGQAIKANYELELMRIKAANERWIAQQSKKYEEQKTKGTKVKDKSEEDYEKEILSLMKERMKLVEKMRGLEQKRDNTKAGLNKQEVDLYEEICKRVLVLNSLLDDYHNKQESAFNNAEQKINIEYLEMEVRLRKELDALLKSGAKVEKTPEEVRIESLVKEYKSVLQQLSQLDKTREVASKTLTSTTSTDEEKDKARKILDSTTALYQKLAERRIEIERETDARIVDMRDKAAVAAANAEAQRLKQEQREREKLASTDPKVAIDFAKNARSLQDLQTAYRNLQKIMATLDPNDPDWGRLNNTLQDTRKRIDNIKQAMGDIKGQSNSLSQTLQNLAMQMGLVFSVQQIMQWVRHMAEVRGQFQLQQIALRSLLQDKQEADKIFIQIQQQALQSPFSIMELNRFTKQVAAYGIEANKLVDTTKRLADVSAGLGVDMGRLVLAYGQVKTANYLRATEVRQFTEAGLNIAGELAKYFSELKGQMISVGDVMEMITKRMVRFEDVEEVFKRVTSAGGMFYDMQKKQSESIVGQIQRIGDAYNIMLNEMGKDHNTTIVTILKSVRLLLQEWRRVEPIMDSVIYGLVTYISVAKGIPLIANMLRALQVGFLKLGRAMATAKTESAALNATLKFNPYAAVATALTVAITLLVEYITYQNQLEADLSRMTQETINDALEATLRYRELADTVASTTKAYKEKKEALDEIHRAYGDILPLQMQEIEGIKAMAGHYDEANDAIKRYYATKLQEQMVERYKTAKEGGFEKTTKDYKSKVKTLATEIKERGIDAVTEERLLSFVSEIIDKINEGAITSAEQAADEFSKRVISYYKTASKETNESIKNVTYAWSKNAMLGFRLFENLIDIQEDYNKQTQRILKNEPIFSNIIEEKAFKKLQEARNEIERQKKNVNELSVAYSNLANLRSKNLELLASGQKGASESAAIRDVIDAYRNLGLAIPTVKQINQILLSHRDITKEISRADEESANKIKASWTKVFESVKIGDKKLTEIASVDKFLSNWQAAIKQIGGTEIEKNLWGTIEKLAKDKKVPLSLFDWLKTDVKTSWGSARKEFEDQAKSFHESLRRYKEAMSVTGVFRDDADKKKHALEVAGLTEEQVQYAKAYEALLEIIKDYLGAVEKEKKGADKTEQTLRNRIQLLKDANAMYEKLRKEMSETNAAQNTYNNLLERANTLGMGQFFQRGKKYTSKATVEDLEQLSKMFGYDTESFKKKYANAFNDLQKALGDMKFEASVELNKESRANIEQQLSDLFTGYELSIELDKAGVPKNLAKSLFDVDDTSLVDISNKWREIWLKKVNTAMLQSREITTAYTNVEEALADLGDKHNEWVNLYITKEREITQKIHKEVETRMKDFMSMLRKSYSQSVNLQVEAYRKLQNLMQVEQSAEMAITANVSISPEQKKEVIASIRAMTKRTAETIQEELNQNIAKLRWDEFRESPLFAELFSNLQYVGTKTIDALIAKIDELKISYGKLDPKIVKELTKYSEKLASVKIDRNPFKSWGENLKKVNDLRKQGLTLDKLQNNLISQSVAVDELNREIDSYAKVLALKQQLNFPIEDNIDLYKKSVETLRDDVEALQKKKEEMAQAPIIDHEEITKTEQEIQRLKDAISAKVTIEGLSLSDEELRMLTRTVSNLEKEIELLKKRKAEKQAESKITKDNIDAYDRLTQSQQKSMGVISELGNTVASAYDLVGNALALSGNKTDEYSQAVMKSIRDITSSVFSLASAVSSITDSARSKIGVVTSALSLLATVLSSILNMHDSELAREITQLDIRVTSLKREFDKLSEAISNSFSGLQLGANTEASIQKLEEQNEMLEKMIATEQQKKNVDEKQISEWRNTIEDNIEEANKLRQQYLTELGGIGTGSEIKDAAQNFVDAWVDAFGETGRGLDGLQNNFDDFIRNIAKKQAYMKVADHWIETFGNMINESFDKYGQVDYEKLQKAMSWFQDTAMPEMNGFLENFADFWQSFGVDLTGKASELSGLAAGIQGVTEETAQILEALLNSMRYFVSDTNDKVQLIATTLTNPPSDNLFLVELRAQTEQLRILNKSLSSVIRGGHSKGGSGIKVFEN